MKRIIATLCLILCFPIIALAADDDIRRPKSGMSLGMNPSLSGGGFAYLLRDDFSIAVAAGSVNGTAAVPGPGGNRVVVDTDIPKNLSITGGNIVLESHSTPAAGDPGLWYDQQTRAIGKILVSHFNASETTGRFMIGWDANQSGNHSASTSFDLDSNGRIDAYVNGSQIPINTYAASTNYYLSLILKGSGCYYLIKTTTGLWYLEYISDYSSANLYPSIIRSNVAGSHLSSFIRIPNYLWTPKPISADSFGGTWPTTDGGGLTGIEAGGSGKTWGEFLSGSGTTGAGVTWDHEWNFSNALTDNPGTGKTALNLTAAAPSYTTDWANRTTEAISLDGSTAGKYPKNAACGSDIGDMGNTYTILVEFSPTNTSPGTSEYLYNTSTTLTNSVIFYHNSGGGQLIYNNFTGSINGSIAEGGKRYQAVIVNSAGSGTMYVNGVAVGTGTLNADPTHADYALVIGDRDDGLRKLTGTISRVATLKGTALTGDQVRAEYRKWVATSNAGVYARFYGGPDPGVNGLTNQAGAVTEGTWGSENAGESSYQAYAIRYKPTADSNPGNYDNSTSFLRRTGTWSIDTGTAVNAPVAGSEILSNTGFETAGGGGADVFANWAEGVAGTSTVNDEGVVVHGGSHACRLDIDASNSQAYVSQGTITVGSWCRISAWVKVDDATGGPKFKIGSASAAAQTLLNVPITTTYVQYINTFRADNAACAINRSDNCASKKIYVDDVSWKPLTLNQLITSINHTSTPDCYMSVKPTIATGFQAGIAFNIDDPNNPTNFNLVYYNQNDGKIYWDKCVNGTYTNVFATTTTYSAGKALVVRKIGTSVYVWYNDAYVNSGTAAVTTGNYHGMFQTGSGTTETKFDDWFCYGSGTNGEYGILNAFSN